MAYTKNYPGGWQPGSGGGTPIDEAALDNIETQYEEILGGQNAYTGTGAGFRDEDDMSSNDATAPSSQQAVKAYADSRARIWVQPHFVDGVGAVLAAKYGTVWAGAQMQSDQTDYTYFSLTISSVFVSLTKAVVVIIPTATGDMRLTATTHFAAAGEAENTHTDTRAVAQYAVVADQLYEYDISSALTGLAANDYVGIQILRDAANVADTSEGDSYVLGILIEG